MGHNYVGLSHPKSHFCNRKEPRPLAVSRLIIRIACLDKDAVVQGSVCNEIIHSSYETVELLFMGAYGDKNHARITGRYLLTT